MLEFQMDSKRMIDKECSPNSCPVSIEAVRPLRIDAVITAAIFRASSCCTNHKIESATSSAKHAALLLRGGKISANIGNDLIDVETIKASVAWTFVRYSLKRARNVLTMRGGFKYF